RRCGLAICTTNCTGTPVRLQTYRLRSTKRLVVARVLLAIASAITTAATLPRWLCGRAADAWFDGDVATEDPLAKYVAHEVTNPAGETFYHTKNERFDGQSAVAIEQMAILGLGQIVLEHPEKRAEYIGAIRAAADRIVDPATLRYAAHVYGHHGIARMDE